MPVILTIEELEIRRIAAQSQPGQIVCKTLYQKYPSQKRAGEVAQGVGPEFKPQNCQKERKKEINDSLVFRTFKQYRFIQNEIEKTYLELNLH
jgi:hypothetical protein